MKDKLQRMLQKLLITLGPFIILGIAITCIIGLFILSWYILLWGFMFGFFLWAYARIRRFLFQKKSSQTKHKGRVIDHEKNR